ncbi:MAG: hypothetical protein ACRC8U_11910, partial [Brooklawnia sp.]
REAIAYQTGLSADEFDIEVVPALPDAYRQAADEADRLRADAARAQRASAESARAAARALHEAGLTLRDIGVVMGISYQRAAQLVA